MIAVLCAFVSSAHGDPGLAGWVGVEGSAKITKRVEVQLAGEARAEVVGGDERELLADAALRLRPLGRFAIDGAYRLIVPLHTDGLAHRLALDARLSHKTGRVVWKGRQRYTLGLSDESKHTLRTRLGAELRLGVPRPYVSIEPFLRVRQGSIGLHKVRFTLGTKLRAARTTFRVFSHFEQRPDGDRLLIGGLGAQLRAPGRLIRRKDPSEASEQHTASPDVM